MKRIACLTALVTMSATAGCVERRFTVFSEPAGALCYINGNYLGPTPADGYITYYGKQKFRLVKEGYETLDVVQKYPAPWYDLPGIDFLTENIWPFKIRDVRRFCYTMRPLQTIPPDDVRMRAEQLRSQGQNIGVPASPRPLAPASPPPPPTPPLQQTPPAPPPQQTLPPPRPVPTPAPGLSGP